MWQALRKRKVGFCLELELLNKLYDLYLMLVGGYVLLLIGTVAYMIEIYRLYKKQEVVQEQIQQEIIDKLEI